MISDILTFYRLLGNRRFWHRYYRDHPDPGPPSPFALFCAERCLKPGHEVLELGCGNGRDAVYLSSLGMHVTALDLCRSEIRYLRRRHGRNAAAGQNGRLIFLHRDFSRFRSPGAFDGVYSRFTLRSISEPQERQSIASAYVNLRPGGMLLIEARSRRDQLFARSQRLSDSEGMTDHYRRFIDPEELHGRLMQAGFAIEYFIESTGLAVHKDEDPWVVRVVARRPA